MTDLNEAYKALKKRNPLAALITSRELWRATEAGLAMIERACDPCELRREYRIRLITHSHKGNS